MESKPRKSSHSRLALQGKLWLGIKVALFLGWFSILHFLYDWFPIGVVGIFGGTSESVFQHMKLAFYAYLGMVGIEYVIFRKEIVSKASYWDKRLLSALMIGWLEIIVWYLHPMFFDSFPTSLLEIIYSFGVLIGIVIWLIGFENNVEFRVNRTGRVLLVIMVVLLVLEYTIFSFKDPWINIFALPKLGI